MLEFIGKHTITMRKKWIEIIQNTWNKISGNAQEFALSGKVKLPESLVSLIKEAESA